MASYKTEIKDGILSRSLTFMGMEFTEVWKEDNTYCPNAICGQVMEAIPDLCGEDAEIIEDLTSLDEDELMGALNDLTVYEKSVN